MSWAYELDENPSLSAELEQVTAAAYPDAVDLAVAETPFDYDAFPKSCPWDEDQILKDYWPTT